LGIALIHNRSTLAEQCPLPNIMPGAQELLNLDVARRLTKEGDAYLLHAWVEGLKQA